MTDITELERRITAALDRIGNGLVSIDTAAPASADSEELQTVRAALDEERTANAQLEERVRAIREKQDTSVATLEAEVVKLTEEVNRRAADAQRLENVNNQLRANNQALRVANESGVGDPHLINKAMMAELDSLRLSRDTDRAELDAILGELKPLVEGRADA